MTPEIVGRYAELSLPRYTSYPTAPHFTSQVDAKTYRAWLAALDVGTGLSLYLHIPFCRSMCWYCGCHTTVTAREAPVDRYVETLLREIRLVAAALPAAMAVRHVHFGGGTPTLLRPDQFRRVVGALREGFAIADDAELAIEVDPRTLSGEMAGALGEAGMTRASIGVQSFDPDVQQAINRIQDFDTVALAVDRLRGAGISGINFDLIYGLPRQTPASCLATIDKAVRLAPDRLAVFGYAHVPDFKLHQRKIDAALLPDGAARWEQARTMSAALVRAGYVAVGLDHYARPDDALARAAAAGTLHRNFQGYTTDACPALIGLGASSIGRLPQGYAQNEVAISAWQEAVRAGRLPIVRGYALGAEDRLRAEIIERLMCDHKVDVGTVCAAFGADPSSLMASADLRPLVADGLVERHGLAIAVKPQARPLVRAVAAAFDAHLPRSRARHARAV